MSDHPDLVVLRTFLNDIDAQMAKSALEAAEIDSMIRADDAGGMRPHLWVGSGVERRCSGTRVYPDRGPAYRGLVLCRPGGHGGTSIGDGTQRQEKYGHPAKASHRAGSCKFAAARPAGLGAARDESRGEAEGVLEFSGSSGQAPQHSAFRGGVMPKSKHLIRGRVRSSMNSSRHTGAACR